MRRKNRIHCPRRPSPATRIMATCLLFAVTNGLQALTLAITDQSGKALPHAVVELLGDNPRQVSPDAEVIQDELMFSPWVSAVPVNTLVHFPNRDKTRHHVYSFSPAKIFEIRLYADTPEAPINFDQSGIVVLGCNIHDHMQAYIYVGESALLAVTDTRGFAQFDQLPAGEYSVRLWHPWQDSETPPQQITVSEDAQTLTLALPVTEQAMPKPPRRGFGKKYR